MSPGTIIPYLQAVLVASWQASIVILLILAIRPLLGVRVPARWRSLLWTLVLARLLIPTFMLPHSPVSFQNIPAVERPIEKAQASMQVEYSEAPFAMEMRQANPPGLEPAHAEPSDAVPAGPAPARNIPWWQIAAICWLMGAALLAGWFVIATVHLQWRLRCESGALEPGVLRAWRACCDRFEVRSQPRVRAVGCIDSPALLGILRPILLIPLRGQKVFTAEDWEHIFMHELAHVRRRDHWTQGLQLLALCAHWFNPLVWIGFRYLRADRELATDELALRRLEGNCAAAYGGTLVKVLSERSTGLLQPGMVGIMEDAAQLKQRLRRIITFGPRRVIGSALGRVVFVLCAATVLGTQLNQTDLSAYDGLSPVQIIFTAASTGDAAAVAKVLDNGVAIDGTSGKPNDDKTALVVAAGADQLDIVRLLVERGAQINPQKAGASPALIAALQNAAFDCTDYLLSKGAADDPLLEAAARGDKTPIDKALAGGLKDFNTLRTLCEIAAVNGRLDIFVELYDAIQALPDWSNWKISDNVAVKAIAHGQRDVVAEMITRGQILNKEGWTRMAAAASKSPGMREWLISKGFKVGEYTVGERLLDAVDQDNLPEIRDLVRKGVSVNYVGEGEDQWTPLTRACERGNLPALKLLLSLGADPNLARPPAYMHFYPICLAKSPEMADALVAAGAKVTAEPYYDAGHIIDHAAMYGPPEMVQWFIDHGVDVDKVKGTPMDPTLLFWVRSPEIAEILLDHGVDVNAKGGAGQTALFQIVQMQENAAKIIPVLLKHGADPNLRAQGGYTPLMAARDGATVDVLIAAGADPSAKDVNGTSVIDHYVPQSEASRAIELRKHGLVATASDNAALLVNAILEHNIGKVRALLAAGTETNPNLGQDFQRADPIEAAMDTGQWEIVDLLRQAGASAVGLLSEAAAKGDLGQMKALINAGADVNESTKTGNTPLQFAIRRANLDSVQFLLDHGANPNLFDYYGFTSYVTAYYFASECTPENMGGDGSPVEGVSQKDALKAFNEIMALLRKHGWDPNYRNKDGDTALHVAAAMGNTMDFDIPDYQSEINAQSSDGSTPLMLAIITQPKNASTTGPGTVTTNDGTQKAQHYSPRGFVVSTLLQKGADLTLKNNAGKTAMDLARENGNAEILGLLKNPPPKDPPPIKDGGK